MREIQRKQVSQGTVFTYTKVFKVCFTIMVQCHLSFKYIYTNFNGFNLVEMTHHLPRTSPVWEIVSSNCKKPATVIINLGTLNPTWKICIVDLKQHARGAHHMSRLTLKLSYFSLPVNMNHLNNSRAQASDKSLLRNTDNIGSFYNNFGRVRAEHNLWLWSLLLTIWDWQGPLPSCNELTKTADTAS